jgi:hypothetical protein
MTKIDIIFYDMLKISHLSDFNYNKMSNWKRDVNGGDLGRSMGLTEEAWEFDVTDLARSRTWVRMRCRDDGSMQKVTKCLAVRNGWADILLFVDGEPVMGHNFPIDDVIGKHIACEELEDQNY